MPEYDLTLFGATGYTGRLVAEYLASHPNRGAFSWAIAGRNPPKLLALQARLAQEHGSEPGLLVADSFDSNSLKQMSERTQVVISTVGPYSTHGGTNVVEQCVRGGTDYAELSGEYFYQRQLIDDFHQAAKSSGARIVLATGVDSVPSDLGAQFAIEELEDSGVPARRVKVLYTRYSGGYSGGTYRSMQVNKSIRDSDLFDPAFHRDPYALAPMVGSEATDESVSGWDRLRFDRHFRKWGMPFFMAPTNARVVRRSLALSDRLPCGYQEGITVSALVRAAWLWISRGFGYFVGDPIPLRPEPGEGPPAWLRRAGEFALLARAEATSGDESVMVEIKGQGDPGYAATSRMLAESGLCLLLDRDRLPDRAGVLTPASALGRPYQERLAAAEQGQFMSFSVLDKQTI